MRVPLQPLYDNLDAQTYEVFEKDSVKYEKYQQAIEAALKDKILVEEKRTKRIVLMIVGAGRGPLIRAAFNAMEKTGRRLKLIIVEKNPHAIVTLTSLINFMYKDRDITLISKDMRQLQLKEKADIIVSELLGSFGDNELSPECLDGAQRHLKPDGISIPCKSSTYICPVMTTTIYENVMKKLAFSDDKKMYAKPTEVNYLVYFSNAYFIDKTKMLWKFEHPNKDALIDNRRHQRLYFKSKVNCVLHGFAGFFVAKLYKDIEISIRPATHSPGLFSWFPMFFPVIEPCFVKAGEEITVDFWRKVDENKVWYEWRANDGKISNERGENHGIFRYSQEQ